MNTYDYAKKAYNVSSILADLPSKTKNRALIEIISLLKENKEKIFQANKEDIAAAEKENLAAPLLKRLLFHEKKLNAVCDGIESLIHLPDPVGKTLAATELDTGLELYKVSCPIGVIGIVFESRPDALVQISTLCLKSGNAVLLKGGKEALRTNQVLAGLIAEAGQKAGLNPDWITLLETRQEIKELLTLHDYVSLIIPRGSNEFVRYIMDNTSIPVLGHADGICHVFVDSSADQEMAQHIVLDSKCQYVAVCNALETLLVHKDIASTFLPRIKTALEEKGVEIRGCERTCSIIDVKKAYEDDWKTEYLDYILSVKIVDTLSQAMLHINTYGSGHTDAIVTMDKKNTDIFIKRVDSADVFVNCSTRFSDGYRFGLGAEVGISTNKIHARGPVGMEGLLIYKYILLGNGHIVSDYGDGKKHFTHRSIQKEFKSEKE